MDDRPLVVQVGPLRRDERFGRRHLSAIPLLDLLRSRGIGVAALDPKHALVRRLLEFRVHL